MARRTLKGDHEDRLIAARAANYRAEAARRFLVVKVDGKAPGRELRISRADAERVENDRGCWEIISATSRRTSRIGRGCARPTGILDGAKLDKSSPEYKAKLKAFNRAVRSPSSWTMTPPEGWAATSYPPSKAERRAAAKKRRR